MSEVRSSRRSGISSNLYVLAMVLIEIDTHISFNGSQTEPEPGLSDSREIWSQKIIIIIIVLPSSSTKFR